MHKKLISLLVCGSLSLTLFSGCESGPNARNGASWGALTGAALGAIVGHQSGDGAEGAALGAVVGGAVGHSVGDERDRHYTETQHYQTELEIARARQARAEEQARQERRIVTGSRTEDAEVLAAKQRAEAAEAELARLRKEREEALARARALEEYEQRRQTAESEIESLQGS